jgi:predicted ABC-type ATPase
MPTLYIIAGPNGVGKTTFADEYLPDEIKRLQFINADLIARGLSRYDPEAVAIEAGKIALKRMRELILLKVSFTCFLWVRHPETTISRIRQRVKEGCYNIPEETSRRRFFKTIQNFFTIYRPLMHSWKLILNELAGRRLLVAEKFGRLVIRDRAEFAQIQKEAEFDL